MVAEISQIATEAARSASSFSGQFILDGALLITALKAIEFGISKYKSRNGSTRESPGMGMECLKHRDELMTIKAEQIATKEDIFDIKADIKELLRRVPPK